MMMANLDDIMNIMREGEKRSNIITADINRYYPFDSSKVIGNILSKIPNVSNKEYRLNFDPAQEIIIRKLITPQMLEKRLIVEAQDFFKAMISVDYYCSTIARSYSLVDDLYAFAQELERKDRRLDPKIDQITKYIVTHSLREVQVDDMTSRFGAWRRTYNQLNNTVNSSYNNLAGTNPLYLESGKLISSCMINVSEYVSKATGQQDIKALIFIDSLYSKTPSRELSAMINVQLQEGDFLKASLLAIQGASKKYYDDQFNKSLDRLR